MTVFQVVPFRLIKLSKDSTGLSLEDGGLVTSFLGPK